MTDVDGLRRLAQAFDRASRAHEGRRRGAGRREPFISHVADVARRVADSPAADESTLLAVLLHDVGEKTNHSPVEIGQAFGPEVAGVVAELTDGPSLSGRERKRRQVEAAPGFSDRAKRIKPADKASKLAAIAAALPRWWGRGKACKEVAQARKVAIGLRGSVPVLEAARAEVALGYGEAGWR